LPTLAAALLYSCCCIHFPKFAEHRYGNIAFWLTELEGGWFDKKEIFSEERKIGRLLMPKDIKALKKK